MTIIDMQQLMKANDDRAARNYEQSVKDLHAREGRYREAHRLGLERFAAELRREARVEASRLMVRELLQVISDPERTDGLSEEELLIAVITYAAGMLDLMELDEPAGLKVRRIGRIMQTEKLVF